MLKLTVPAGEYFNEQTNEFHYTKESRLHLEHSLASVARWESKWKKPFLESSSPLLRDKYKKTPEEFYDYLRCMTVNQPEDPNCYRSLTPLQLQVISNYLKDPATASTFSDYEEKKFSSQIITSELIYFWMTTLNIPFSCEEWNLNRLLALIRVCSIKNGKPKKKPRRDMIEERKRLNQERRQQWNTRG